MIDFAYANTSKLPYEGQLPIPRLLAVYDSAHRPAAMPFPGIRPMSPDNSSILWRSSIAPLHPSRLACSSYVAWQRVKYAKTKHLPFVGIARSTCLMHVQT